MKERFEVLDIFRGIFASMVVLFHLTLFSSTPVLNNDFIKNCDLFVDFFFVLSGFVMAFSYQNISSKKSLTTYYKKRFFRLYPLHIIILLLFVPVQLSKHFLSGYAHSNKVDYNTPVSFLSNLFLINSVKLPGINDVSWNGPSWSISAEMISYIIFGLVIFLISKYGLSRFKTGIYLLIVFAAALILFSCTRSFDILYTYNYGFLRGIIGFFLGCVCYSTYFNTKAYLHKKNATLFHLLEIGSITLIIFSVARGDLFKDYRFAYELLFYITVLVFAFEKGWVSALLKKSGFLHLTGKYSYSIYMTHSFILLVFNIIFIRILKFPPSAYAYLFIINYAIIWLLSSLSFKYIEMRFRFKNNPSEKKSWWIW